MLAERGSEGWESLLKYAENENEEVVGSVNGNGMLKTDPAAGKAEVEMKDSLIAFGPQPWRS